MTFDEGRPGSIDQLIEPIEQVLRGHRNRFGRLEDPPDIFKEHDAEAALPFNPRAPPKWQGAQSKRTLLAFRAVLFIVFVHPLSRFECGTF